MNDEYLSAAAEYDMEVQTWKNDTRKSQNFAVNVAIIGPMTERNKAPTAITVMTDGMTVKKRDRPLPPM